MSRDETDGGKVDAAIDVDCPRCARSLPASDLESHLFSLHVGEPELARREAKEAIESAKSVSFAPDPVVPPERRTLVYGLLAWVVSAVLAFDLREAAALAASGTPSAAIRALGPADGLGSVALLVYVFVVLGLGWRVGFALVDRATDQ